MPEGPRLTTKRLHLQLVQGGHNRPVLADPEGNDFCLFAKLALAGGAGIAGRDRPFLISRNVLTKGRIVRLRAR
jgi:hypothetical protein